jgi:hypothetical protein
MSFLPSSLEGLWRVVFVSTSPTNLLNLHCVYSIPDEWNDKYGFLTCIVYGRTHKNLLDLHCVYSIPDEWNGMPSTRSLSTSHIYMCVTHCIVTRYRSPYISWTRLREDGFLIVPNAFPKVLYHWMGKFRIHFEPVLEMLFCSEFHPLVKRMYCRSCLLLLPRQVRIPCLFVAKTQVLVLRTFAVTTKKQRARWIGFDALNVFVVVDYTKRNIFFGRMLYTCCGSAWEAGFFFYRKIG